MNKKFFSPENHKYFFPIKDNEPQTNVSKEAMTFFFISSLYFALVSLLLGAGMQFVGNECSVVNFVLNISKIISQNGQGEFLMFHLIPFHTPKLHLSGFKLCNILS